MIAIRCSSMLDHTYSNLFLKLSTDMLSFLQAVSRMQSSGALPTSLLQVQHEAHQTLSVSAGPVASYPEHHLKTHLAHQPANRLRLMAASARKIMWKDEFQSRQAGRSRALREPTMAPAALLKDPRNAVSVQ
jgi:hypothetical protein